MTDEVSTAFMVCVKLVPVSTSTVWDFGLLCGQAPATLHNECCMVRLDIVYLLGLTVKERGAPFSPNKYVI